MLLIHRYMLATFLRNLAYTLVGALVLFTMLDLLGHIGAPGSSTRSCPSPCSWPPSSPSGPWPATWR